MAEPSLGALRAASANLMAANLALSMFPYAAKAAVDHEQYIARAATLGFDRETAQRVSDEVWRSGMVPSSEIYRWALMRLYELLDDPKPKPMTVEDARRIVSALANCKGGE
jgi:hypothetical protein